MFNRFLPILLVTCNLVQNICDIKMPKHTLKIKFCSIYTDGAFKNNSKRVFLNACHKPGVSVAQQFQLLPATSQTSVTCVRAICGPAVVGIGCGRLLDLSHSSPLLFPHLHFRLRSSRAHVWNVSLIPFGAVPVRSPLPVLDGLLPESPVSRAASRRALIPSLT